MISLRHVSLWAGVIAGSLVVGGFVGKAVSWLLAEVEDKNSLQRRIEQRQAILSDMGTLGVGDRLQDHVFEDTRLRAVQLSALTPHTVVISIIEPDCQVCVEEVYELLNSVRYEVLETRVIFISAGNPRFLAELVDSSGLPSPVLYDHHAAWLGYYKIFTYPFNIVVDSLLCVQEIITAKLSARDFDRLGINTLAGDLNRAQSRH